MQQVTDIEKMSREELIETLKIKNDEISDLQYRLQNQEQGVNSNPPKINVKVERGQSESEPDAEVYSSYYLSVQRVDHEDDGSLTAIVALPT